MSIAWWFHTVTSALHPYPGEHRTAAVAYVIHHLGTQEAKDTPCIIVRLRAQAESQWSRFAAAESIFDRFLIVVSGSISVAMTQFIKQHTQQVAQCSSVDVGCLTLQEQCAMTLGSSSMLNVHEEHEQ